MTLGGRPGDPSHRLRRLPVEKAYKGSCFCGTVQFTVSGDPAGMGYCHCESCRKWSAGPVNAFTLWKPGALKVTSGADRIGTYNKTPNSFRKWCKECGGHVFTDHPGMGLVDIYAAVIDDFPFQAGVHVNYQETELAMKDGLPKMKDLPKEMGGSGLMMAD
ncbi:MAG: GFA family protein [Usitatibacter sp.]